MLSNQNSIKKKKKIKNDESFVAYLFIIIIPLTFHRFLFSSTDVPKLLYLNNTAHRNVATLH